MTCDRCRGWGRTLDEYEISTVPFVRCPGCRRPTWPNLGVDLPAGCAVDPGTIRCVQLLRLGDLRAAASRPAYARPLPSAGRGRAGSPDDAPQALRDRRDAGLVVPGVAPPGRVWTHLRGRAARG